MAIAIYVVIYAILVFATVAEVAVFNFSLGSSATILSIVGLAGVKAGLIAYFYQHLRDEPRSVSALVMVGVLTVVLFMVLSLLSIRIF